MLTVQTVAERLQVQPATVRRWLREGRLRGVKPWGDKTGYRIPESEIARLLKMDNP
jgi:excisionase family DNA binding protein